VQRKHGRCQEKKIVNLNYIDPFDYKVNVITKIGVFKGYVDTKILVKQVWSLEFITLEVNGKEIIHELLFFIQILKLIKKNWNWYLELLYSWRE
jgi:hypothetical protein